MLKEVGGRTGYRFTAQACQSCLPDSPEVKGKALGSGSNPAPPPPFPRPQNLFYPNDDSGRGAPIGWLVPQDPVLAKETPGKSDGASKKEMLGCLSVWG